METIIPNQILRKTDSAVDFFEIQSLNFPIPDIESYILYDAGEIELRQNLFRDIFDCPQLLEKYEKLSEQMENLSECFQKSGEDRDNESIIYSLIKIQFFTEIIDYIADTLYPLTENHKIKAKSMVDFINACVSVSESESYNNVKSWLNNLDSNLKNIKSITMGVNLDAQFKVNELGIVSFNTSPFVGGGVINSVFRDENPDESYQCMISLGISETKKLLGRSIISVNNEIFNAMNTVFKGTLKKIRRDILNSFKQEAIHLSELEMIWRS